MHENPQFPNRQDFSASCPPPFPASNYAGQLYEAWIGASLAIAYSMLEAREKI